MDKSSVVEALLKTPVAQAALRDQAEELLARRKRAVDEIQRLQASHLAERRRLEADWTDAKAKLAALEPGYRTALDRCNRLEGALAAQSGDHPASAVHTMLLRATAPEMIQAFLSELGQIFENVRLQHVPDRRSGGEWYQALSQKMARIKAARERAEAMVFEALSEDDMSAEIDRLRQNIETGGPIH